MYKYLRGRNLLFLSRITSAPGKRMIRVVNDHTFEADSFSSFAFDALLFYLPRPISTYVRKPLRKQGHTNTYV